MRIEQEDIKKAIIYWARYLDKKAGNSWTVAYLAPYFAEEPPKGLDPTMYHTGSYEGDLEEHLRLKGLVESVI